MTAKPPSSKHGFRAIPLEDFDWEAARHFARTNGTSVEEALFEYTREQYVNQLLTEWQSASQIFCRFIERMAPHASPVEIVLALRETAKTYDDLVTAGLLMRDGVKLLFLVNELASLILSRQELREEEEKAACTKNEAALRFALFEKLLPKPLYGLIVRNALAYYEDGDEGVLPRSIATRAAFLNAMTLDIAMGGSTNTVLHLLAVANEAGVDFSMKDIDRLSRKVPCL